jgi:hypothetical protein
MWTTHGFPRKEGKNKPLGCIILRGVSFKYQMKSLFGQYPMLVNNGFYSSRVDLIDIQGYPLRMKRGHGKSCS